jgi:RNA polymerase sigma-70 factor (ECF subfamily)
LLSRVARGDAGGIAACIDEFGSLVWALARRMTPNRDEAEDAVQEIFMDIWKSAARFDPLRGSEQVFITMIARRRLIDRLRRHAQQPEFASTDDLDVIGFAEPGNRGEVSVEAERAAAAVAELKADQQRVIELAVIHGLSHGEIAARTGMALGTVKTQMRRGLIRVREMLGIDAPAVAGGGP